MQTTNGLLTNFYLWLVNMKIRIITIGQKMPSWIQTGYQDYNQRIQSMLPTELVELPMAKRTAKNPSPAQISQYCDDEGKRILANIKKNETLVCLEVTGKSVTTEKLADKLSYWMQEGNDIAVVIGGPDGLSQAVLQKASWKWSLSDLTLPHPLVRVLLIEQLYRAMSINHNHPYHRA